MTEAKVRGILAKGVLLVNIVNSSSYPDEIREQAFRMMRENVVGLHRMKKELKQ